MNADRATVTTPFADDPAPRPVLALVPDTLETLLTGVIAQLRAAPDTAADCRRDAIAAIAIGRATGLLKPRSPHLTLCRAAESR